MNFYTSDTHWGHKNILKFCDRPWATVEEMDTALIQNWNARVTVDDDIYLLGDFCFRSKNRAAEYLAQLNGRKHLVRGNHDPSDICALSGWSSVQSYLELTEVGPTGEDGKPTSLDTLILFHYPMREWNKCHRGSYHLWGHCHGNQPAYGRSLDIGVDCWGYRPVTFAEVKQRLIDLGLNDQIVFHHNPSKRAA
jgi:calcineurin-like phosphoesterase family protein